MKKDKIKDSFLEQLRKIPIVQVACEKTNISRNSVYRWKNEDKEFQKEMETALAEGEALVNDMSESQLLTMIKEKNFSAISFWLRHRNARFKDKVEVTAKIEGDEQLTPEQEAVVREALRLASSPAINSLDDIGYGTIQDDTAGFCKDNDLGQES
jgi:predicted DNA binding protein